MDDVVTTVVVNLDSIMHKPLWKTMCVGRLAAFFTPTNQTTLVGTYDQL